MSDGVALGDLLGGGKAFAFNDIGDKVDGVITLIEERQQTSFDDNQPLFWDDGRPRMLHYIEVQTDLNDGDGDDGVRALYAKGGSNFEVATGSGNSMAVAIGLAAKAMGASSVKTGQRLQVAYTGDAKPVGRLRPAKLFTAKLSEPEVAVETEGLFD